MSYFRIFLSTGLIAATLCVVQPLAAENYPLIIRGTVVMRDGGPYPKSVGIERVCTDGNGSAPITITNKKGEYEARMMVDPTLVRTCSLRATSEGLTSTYIDISNLNGYIDTHITLPPLSLFVLGSNPYAIYPSEEGVPSKAGSAWKAAMKAVDANNMPEAIRQLELAVKTAPQFAKGWHTLGILYDEDKKRTEARAAYEHAIAADPKMLTPLVALTRLCIRAEDWQCANTTATTLVKVDAKRVFPQAYLHQAVARFQLKDLPGAEAAALEAIKLELTPKLPRIEYVLGRILDAKGDHDGARQHITKYLELDPNVADAVLIKARLEDLGKSDISWAGTDLELL